MKSGGIEKERDFVEMRKSRRINYLSKIYCKKCICGGETEEYKEPLELTLLNVSVGGLGIMSDRMFEVGSILTLSMKLEEISYEKVTAKVMWNIKKGEMYRHGLQIVNISGRLFRHLSRLDNSITTTV